MKYHKRTGELIEKGAEVSMVIDLIHYGHLSDDRYDKAVVLCNELAKYRSTFNTIQKILGKRLKVYSFSQEYENNFKDFMKFVDQVGEPKNKSLPSTEEVHYEKPFNFSHGIDMLNQNSLRNRFNSNSNISNADNKPPAFMFIDYGNIHHSLQDMKKVDQSLHTLSEQNLILKL